VTAIGHDHCDRLPRVLDTVGGQQRLWHSNVAGAVENRLDRAHTDEVRGGEHRGVGGPVDPDDPPRRQRGTYERHRRATLGEICDEAASPEEEIGVLTATNRGADQAQLAARAQALRTNAEIRSRRYSVEAWMSAKGSTSSRAAAAAASH
jgi:hypothetical protein